MILSRACSDTPQYLKQNSLQNARELDPQLIYLFLSFIHFPLFLSRLLALSSFFYLTCLPCSRTLSQFSHWLLVSKGSVNTPGSLGPRSFWAYFRAGPCLFAVFFLTWSPRKYAVAALRPQKKASTLLEFQNNIADSSVFILPKKCELFHCTLEKEKKMSLKFATLGSNEKYIFCYIPKIILSS